MKRQVDESYEDYRKRRAEAKKRDKARLKGFLYWNSSTRGTMTKELEQKFYEEVAEKMKQNIENAEEQTT